MRECKARLLLWATISFFSVIVIGFIVRLKDENYNIDVQSLFNFAFMVLLVSAATMPVTALICRYRLARQKQLSYETLVASAVGTAFLAVMVPTLFNDGLDVFTVDYWLSVRGKMPTIFLLPIMGIIAVTSVLPALGVIVYYQNKSTNAPTSVACTEKTSMSGSRILILLLIAGQLIAVETWVVLPKFTSGLTGGESAYRAPQRMAAFSEWLHHPSPDARAAWDEELRRLKNHRLHTRVLPLLALALFFNGSIIYHFWNHGVKKPTA